MGFLNIAANIGIYGNQFFFFFGKRSRSIQQYGLSGGNLDH